MDDLKDISVIRIKQDVNNNENNVVDFLFIDSKGNEFMLTAITNSIIELDMDLYQLYQGGTHESK